MSRGSSCDFFHNVPASRGIAGKPPGNCFVQLFFKKALAEAAIEMAMEIAKLLLRFGVHVGLLTSKVLHCIDN